MVLRTRSVRTLAMLLAMLGAIVDNLAAQADQAVGYGTFDAEAGIFPDSTGMKRPYVVRFTSRFDGAADYFTISFPRNFDPQKTYPLWFKFCPFYGSRSAIKRPTLAWNYCDDNNAIIIGCNERGVGESFFGDNQQLRDPAFLKEKKHESLIPENIPKDVLELANEMCHLFKINYIGATGASMGGYASLRLMTRLPRDHVGVVVSSCPALYFRPWVKDGSDQITQAVKQGHFKDAFVKILHGTADDTVPIQVARELTAMVPDKHGWELVEVRDAGHRDFFCCSSQPKYPYDEDWGKSDVVPDLWAQIHAWENASPKRMQSRLPPLASWQPGASWYLPKVIVEAAAH